MNNDSERHLTRNLRGTDTILAEKGFSVLTQSEEYQLIPGKRYILDAVSYFLNTGCDNRDFLVFTTEDRPNFSIERREYNKLYEGTIEVCD